MSGNPVLPPSPSPKDRRTRAASLGAAADRRAAHNSDIRCIGMDNDGVCVAVANGLCRSTFHRSTIPSAMHKPHFRVSAVPTSADADHSLALSGDVIIAYGGERQSTNCFRRGVDVVVTSGNSDVGCGGEFRPVPGDLPGPCGSSVHTSRFRLAVRRTFAAWSTSGTGSAAPARGGRSSR